jgi:hypothetical protein
LLLGLGWTGFVSALVTFLAIVVSCFTRVPYGILGGIISLPLTVGVCLLTRKDLRQMNAGDMDPAGKTLTERAEAIAAFGSALIVIAYSLYTVLLAGLLSSPIARL